MITLSTRLWEKFSQHLLHRKWSARCLERLAQEIACHAATFSNYRDSAPDFTSLRAEADEVLRSTFCNRKLRRLLWASWAPRFLSLAKLLLSRGFNVTGIYGDNSIFPDNKRIWVTKQYQIFRDCYSGFSCFRFYPRDEASDGKLLTNRSKAAYFTGTSYWKTWLPITTGYDTDRKRKSSSSANTKSIVS